VDWEAAGLTTPSSTWTYTINDSLTESNLIRGLANNPMVMLAAAWMVPLLPIYGVWQRLQGSRSVRSKSAAPAPPDSDESDQE
jgi:hypothetical protein